jgi:hypothetical protein
MRGIEDHQFVYDHGYLPEHLTAYVSAVSEEAPHLHEGHLCFVRKKHMTFVGYPLGPDAHDTPSAYESACERFKPESVGLMAPEIWLPEHQDKSLERDHYYRLKLPLGKIDADTAYMVRRGSRELTVNQGTFSREHKKLLKAFIADKDLPRPEQLIYKRIPHYLKRSDSAVLLEARKGKELTAFTVVDIGTKDYAFYMFNIRSEKTGVPGASDLLFSEMARMAHEAGKPFLNLGLGISPGIRRFKEKWGAGPFVSHESVVIHRKQPDMSRLMSKL